MRVGASYELRSRDVNESSHPCTPDFNSREGKEHSRSDSRNMEHYCMRLEKLFLDWEEYGHKLFDKQSESIGVFVRDLQNEIVTGPIARAERLVKYIETTNIGSELQGMEFTEKIGRAIEYIDGVIEESRLSQAIQTALASSCDRLLNYEELPGPWQENPYIVSGYRFSSGPLDCLRSIFNWHNETANIWTHLLAAILFIGLGLFHLPQTSSWQNGTWLDRVPMVLFILAALKCLICSVTWHSFSSISHLVTKQRMACVDYTGITVCICASILTTEYSVLKCHPIAQAFYMFITFVCGGLGIVLNWHPMFDNTGSRPLRALFFSCFAVFGGLCGIHACFYRGIAGTLVYYIPVVKSLLCYGVGVLFYATLFPERFFKHTFDYCGMSHNIWHTFVVAGIYYHYKAMIEIFDTAVKEVCPLL